MREIEFRGKISGTDIWIYGDLISPATKNDCYAICRKNENISLARTVDENTIGEYTGINDFFNDKIYTDDILVAFDGNNDGKIKYKVVFAGGAFMMNNLPDSRKQVFIDGDIVRKTGTIHDK